MAQQNRRSPYRQVIGIRFGVLDTRKCASVAVAEALAKLFFECDILPKHYGAVMGDLNNSIQIIQKYGGKFSEPILAQIEFAKNDLLGRIADHKAESDEADNVANAVATHGVISHLGID